MQDDIDDRTRVAHAHTGAWVADTLRSRIADGRLAPGSRLSEQSWSTALGVSRNTLREAFTTLAGESIVKRIPNRGVFVASPDADDIREIYNVRRAIEPGAILWGTVSDDALAQLQAIVAGARGARENRDVAAMADANQAFHKAVVALTGSHTLNEVMARVLAEMRLVFHAMADLPDFHSQYVNHNIAVVDHLCAGQRHEGAERLRACLDISEAELLSHIARS